MSTTIEVEKLEELEFKWGMKRGVGGLKKAVRFYESFTYDGMDYTLYDCVYMYKEGEPAPYIGKLVKIWENSDKSRKIKVHWFFRPSEISYYLRDAVLMENELFFASGDGTGLANVNPLEAIAGKCNVVCVSRDSRNPQPSAEELQMADHVFYRIFDVKSGTVSDQMDDTVGGIEVKYVFNRTESVRALDVGNLNSSGNDEERNVIACGKKLEVAGKNSLQQSTNVKLDENVDHMLEKEGINAKEVQVKQGSLPGECSSGDHVNSSKIRQIKGISLEKKSMLGDTNVGCKNGSEKDTIKDIKSPDSQVKVEERVKSARNSGYLDDTQSKKAKLKGTFSSLEVKDINAKPKSPLMVQSLTSPGKDVIVTGAPSSNAKPKSELNNNLDGSGKDVKLAGKSSFLDEKLLQASVPSKEAPKSRHAEDSVGLGKDAKLTKDLNALHGNQSKGNDFLSKEKMESAHAKDSVATEKEKKCCENLSARIERPSKTNVVSPNVTPKSGSNKDFQGSPQLAKLVKNPSASTKMPLKRNGDLSKEKSNIRNGAEHENKNTMLAKDSSPLGGPPRKKAKFDASVKMSEDCKNNSIENMKEKICPGEIKNSPRPVAFDNTTKPKLGKDASKENLNDKVGKPSRDNLPTPSITTCNGDDGKVESRIFEVTRRPIVEKSNWMKVPWEDKMKTAHDQRRLVLLRNLDPEYTSGEVEDIVWHAFKEECTAKMVQHSAISNPYSGQAFVIFKASEAVDRVIKKLDVGCLMLPNQRPLVVCTVDFLKFLENYKFLEKQTTFVGHLAIDKDRRQMQRDMKDAVATSHYSQNNTIEYEMAMAWCLLQSKADRWWEVLYKQQRKEIKKLTNDLKSK